VKIEELPDGFVVQANGLSRQFECDSRTTAKMLRALSAAHAEGRKMTRREEITNLALSALCLVGFVSYSIYDAVSDAEDAAKPRPVAEVPLVYQCGPVGE
jgi:hypothetical protein